MRHTQLTEDLGLSGCKQSLLSICLHPVGMETSAQDFIFSQNSFCCPFSLVPSRKPCWNYQIGFLFIFYSVFIGLTLCFLVCVLSCTHRYTVYGCPQMPEEGVGCSGAGVWGRPVWNLFLSTRTCVVWGRWAWSPLLSMRTSVSSGSSTALKLTFDGADALATAM